MSRRRGLMIAFLDHVLQFTGTCQQLLGQQPYYDVLSFHSTVFFNGFTRASCIVIGTMYSLQGPGEKQVALVTGQQCEECGTVRKYHALRMGASIVGPLGIAMAEGENDEDKRSLLEAGPQGKLNLTEWFEGLSQQVLKGRLISCGVVGLVPAAPCP